MLRAIKLAAAIAALGLSAGACATVTTGTSQSINIDSEPQGAECTLMRGGQPLAAVTTPTPVTIKRNQQTIHVRCKKEGFEESLVVMNSRFETSSAGNFLLGGIIGVMVDQSSGAASRYDPYVMVRMTPLSPADAAAAAARPRPAPTAPPSPQAEAALAASVAIPAPTPPPAAPQYGPGKWKARPVLLVNRSAGSCVTNSVNNTNFEFDFAGGMLAVDVQGSRAASAAVPADGSVNQTFKATSPLRPTLVLTGNVRTRDMELASPEYACFWKLPAE